jgi:hypothetical protein
VGARLCDLCPDANGGALALEARDFHQGVRLREARLKVQRSAHR